MRSWGALCASRMLTGTEHSASLAASYRMTDATEVAIRFTLGHRQKAIVSEVRVDELQDFPRDRIRAFAGPISCSADLLLAMRDRAAIRRARARLI